jgi:hypothetical protein
MVMPSHFARFTHVRTWSIAMGRQPTTGMQVIACRLIAELDQPRVTRQTPAHPARYRITTHDPRR